MENIQYMIPDMTDWLHLRGGVKKTIRGQNCVGFPEIFDQRTE